MKNQVLGLGISLASLMLATAWGQDVTRPPTASDREKIPSMGWNEAAGLIEPALKSGWKPGRGGAPGASGNAAFQSWLLLWQWCELLGRSESDEFARFARQFLYKESTSTGPRIVQAPSGFAVPADVERLSRSEVNEVLARYLGRALATFAPPGYAPEEGRLADRLSPEFAAALTRDEMFLRRFFATLSDRDLTPAVLATLNRIGTERAPRWKEYSNLALAIAVVFDQRLPDFWPHDQVPPAQVPIAFPDPVAAFDFWVQTNEDGKSYFDLRKLDADELKFIVDAPVQFSELEWAQKNVRFPRNDWGRAFSSIPYSFDRLRAEQYDWNDSPYTLAAIRSAGGICVDQAYFAMMTGKARGLPTLFFTGQGVDGGHAWFGYLRSENRWDMDCGRYENQNYAVGKALDPQTWLPISDHDLASLAKSFRRTTTYTAARNDLVMARRFEATGDTTAAASALQSAITTSPQNPDAWRALGEFLERTGAPVEKRIEHHEAALKQFPNDHDIRVANQRALAELARASGDTARASELEAKIISQNRLNRSDLSVEAGSEKVAALIDSGDTESAIREVRTLVRRLGPTAGGSVFYELVRPMVGHLHQSGKSDEALRVLNQARSAIDPSNDSVLQQEFLRLEASLANPPDDK